MQVFFQIIPKIFKKFQSTHGNMSSKSATAPSKPASAQRLTEFRESLRLNYEEFGNPLGVSHSTVRRWERGETTIDNALAQKIADCHNGSSEWLLTGRGYMSILPINKASIPMRPLRLFYEATGDCLTFEEEWLVSRVGVAPENLFLAIVDGDSMVPTLNPGDLVMVDTSANAEVFMDGLWIFKIGNVIHLKRLWQLGPGRFEAKGDNPIYGEITLNKLPEIIGKVVWSDRRW